MPGITRGRSQRILDCIAEHAHAAYGRRADLGPDGPRGVYKYEILHYVYGWPYAQPNVERRRPWEQQFDPKAIGSRRYSSDRRSLSRTLTRLADRGLLVVEAYGRYPERDQHPLICLAAPSVGVVDTTQENDR